MEGSADKTTVKPTVVKKKSGNQGGIILGILMLGVGGAGFGLGFTQKFIPTEILAPESTLKINIATPPLKALTPGATTPGATAPAMPSTTPGATTPAMPSTTPSATTPALPATPQGAPPAITTAAPAASSSPAASTALKHAYWIQTSGWDRAGFEIKVYINDQLAGTFATIDQTEDITKLVKAGDNKVRFDAKALPAGNRNDFANAFLTISINQGQKTDTGFTNAKTLVEYKRKVSEMENFDDVMDFATLE
jgi:hypothetical protein